MTKLFKKTSNKIGMAPGSLVHIGEKKIEQTRIEIIDYDEKHLRQQEVETIEECFPFRDEPTVTWINIDGLHEVEIIEKIGNHFDIHPLVLEDILHTGQRPKAEDFGKYIYIVLRSLSFDEEQEEILEEQISLLVGSNYVISFQERVGDEFNPVRERIRTGRFQMKKRKADFVAYSLIDAVVDNYFLILEKIGEKIESIEDELLENPKPVTLQSIHLMKRKLITLRKSVWPLREVIGGLERGESSLFHKSTTVYLKDVYDHTIQVIDTIETYRDMVSGMLDIYLSNLSNKMNEVMKVLTIIATIFIPLTFIAGIYGMNFEFMPELKWHWGYFLILGLMIIIGIGMVFYFQRKKWL
jgi:magnesium transporter